MKLFIAFLFIVINSTCWSQSKELVQYYSFVNKAERNISEGHYAEAYGNYRNAFKLKKRPFEADIINYLKTSILINHIKQLKADPFLKDNQEIKILIENDSFLNKNRSILSFIIDNTIFNENPKKTFFTKQIDSISKIDQAIRQVCDNVSKPCRIKLKATDSITMALLLNLFEQYGLSEAICNRDCMRKIYVILLHSRRWGHLQGDPYLLQSIKEGGIKQVIFAIFNNKKGSFDPADIDSIHKQAFDKLPDLGTEKEYCIFNDTLLHFKVTQGFRDSCNANRASIMMPPMEEDGKKLQCFMDKNSPFYNCYWDFGFQKNTYDIPKEVFNAAIKRWKDHNSLIQ